MDCEGVIMIVLPSKIQQWYDLMDGHPIPGQIQDSGRIRGYGDGSSSGTGNTPVWDLELEPSRSWWCSANFSTVILQWFSLRERISFVASMWNFSLVGCTREFFFVKFTSHLHTPLHPLASSMYQMLLYSVPEKGQCVNSILLSIPV